MSTRNPPAFPRPYSWDESPNTGIHSGDRPEAHPEQDGMTLRDYFAAAALQGWLASWPMDGGPASKKSESLAASAYHIADAMLAERAK